MLIIYIFKSTHAVDSDQTKQKIEDLPSKTPVIFIID